MYVPKYAQIDEVENLLGNLGIGSEATTFTIEYLRHREFSMKNMRTGVAGIVGALIGYLILLAFSPVVTHGHKILGFALFVIGFTSLLVIVECLMVRKFENLNQSELYDSARSYLRIAKQVKRFCGKWPLQSGWRHAMLTSLKRLAAKIAEESGKHRDTELLRAKLRTMYDYAKAGNANLPGYESIYKKD